MANFIELIAKIKQKNNGTFKLVDAQDVECDDGKGLDEVLNEKLDKNLGAENTNKVLVTDADGNVTTQNKEDFEGGGITDYNDLTNKPSINGVELSGNKNGNDIGLVDAQQGTANAGKVLGIGQDGLVVPVENAGASDNIIYKDVPKQLNPNVTDSFLRAMWNLKLYGQSTQGADPSPTNKQDITVISQIDGAPTGGNIFNPENNQKGYYTSVGVGSPIKLNKFNGWSYVCELISGLTGQYTFSLTTSINVRWLFYIADENDICIFNYGDSSANASYNTYTFTMPEGAKKIYLSVLELTGADQVQIMLNPGTTATPYTPYVAQPFTYTPSQNMYSTQDGSIADYVDVEKGVEVYNMISEKPNISGRINRYQLGTHDEYEILNALTNKYFAKDVARDKNCFCNKFVFSNTSPIAVNSFALGGNNLYIRTESNRFNDVDEFREWLNSINTEDSPLIVVYATTTPTETPIPQEQLAMLKALYTYTGVTNFLCNAPVSFTYERSLQIVINNLENAINQTNANILLGGTL